MRVGIACILVVLGIGAAVGGAYALAVRALDNSQQALCPIVRLVLAHPVPYPKDPKANPSRLAAWQSYQDFVIVKRQYHC